MRLTWVHAGFQSLVLEGWSNIWDGIVSRSQDDNEFIMALFATAIGAFGTNVFAWLVTGSTG